MPIGIPVGVRLGRKGGPTTLDLATEIICELASWLPDRDFALCGDGAYAPLAGRGLPATSVTSRMRRDAALFEAAQPKTGKAGRPAKKGKRLPSPAEMAAGLRDAALSSVTVEWRGGTKDLLVWSTPVLRYSVATEHMVQLVIVRDPTRRMHDDFFVTTDLDASPAWVASHYASRWCIECVNREVKQVIRAEDPQCWKYKGPERAASLSLWLYAAIWTRYIPTHGTTTSIPRPWYPTKTTPSFSMRLLPCAVACGRNE